MSNAEVSEIPRDNFERFCEALTHVKPRILFCEQFDEKSSIWNFERHKHDCIEILYFLYGNAEVRTTEKIVQASFYDIVIYPSNTYHTEHLQFNHHQEVICIWADIPGLVLDDIIHIQDKDSNIKWVLEKLHEAYKSEKPCRCLIENYTRLATMLIAKARFEQKETPDALSRIILYLQSNMAENITVEEISELIYVSKSYLSRYFKQRTGMSLIEYLRLLRINTAKKLLVSTNSSVEEISSIIGYNSSKYFCRAFKTCTGMSPTEYKRSEKSNAGNGCETDFNSPVNSTQHTADF